MPLISRHAASCVTLGNRGNQNRDHALRARDDGTAPHARLAALRDFGGVTQAKERHRDVRSFVWLEDAWRDVRYPARLLLRNPGFTAVVVCSLALGIGANTALFSVMDALMLRPARR
jgi:hypothetical protein